MKYGLVGLPLGRLYASLDASPRATVLRIARAADEFGFDFVCAQDHIVAPREWAEPGNGTTWYDPFSTLSFIASATERVRLLTDVIVLPYRSPFAVAKCAATLDQLSDGRVVLGVAAGYLEREFRILGAEFERRGAFTDEAVEAIKAAWTNEWVNVSGEFVNAHDVAVSPRPLQQPRPPIWVGGNSLRALRRAVEHGDGWTPFTGSPERLAASMRTARDDFGLDRPFDVAALMREVFAEDERHIDANGVLRRSETLAAAGVTHVKVAFHGPTLDDFVRAMEEFATGVIAR
jgi:probable F420-dependent oxidoreductase